MGGDDLTCNQCKKTFSKSSNLDRHMKAVHEGDIPYMCTQCDYKTSERCNLKRHMMRSHDEKPYSCVNCGQSFSRTDSLSRHMRIHTGERPLACVNCGQAFRDPSTLNRHLKKICNKHTGNDKDPQVDSDSRALSKTNTAFTTAQHSLPEDNYTMTISNSPQGQLADATNLMFDQQYSFEIKYEELLE